jgi:alkylation response protein AidB-like acyl-CoA dehydrogenase
VGRAVNLAPSPEQAAIQETFADVFAKESSPVRLRDAVPSGHDPALWRLLCELGAPGIAVGDDAGGVGAGLLELVLIAEQAGRRLACVPLVEAAVGARVLAEAGTAPALLERALAGDALVVFAPRPSIEGVATLVPAGAVADAVVVLDDDALVLVEGPPGTAVADLGFQALADRPLTGDGLQWTAIASGSEARSRWRDARGQWETATAAVLIGLAAEAVAMAVRYALERVQFGVPIATFQALQQPLADIQTAIEGGELLAREAAWRRDGSVEGADRLAAMAYAHASHTAERATTFGLHVHGGYGYTLEYDIQYYLRRAKALALAAGDPEIAWEAIGASAIAARS